MTVSDERPAELAADLSGRESARAMSLIPARVSELTDIVYELRIRRANDPAPVEETEVDDDRPRRRFHVPYALSSAVRFLTGAFAGGAAMAFGASVFIWAADRLHRR